MCSPFSIKHSFLLPQSSMDPKCFFQICTCYVSSWKFCQFLDVLSLACFLTIRCQNIVFKHLIGCITKNMFRNHIHCIQTWCFFRNILKRSCTSYILFFWYGEKNAKEMHFFLHIKKMGWDPTTIHMCKQPKNCLGTHVGSCVKVLHVQA